jgi:hypothetical protein
MKEKISLVQLTNNQQKDVKAGFPGGGGTCDNAWYYGKCGACAAYKNNCAQVAYHLPPCPRR